MPSPRISIVVLTYNSDRIIGECLKSIQPLADRAELIVVDNASADETRRVVSRHCPPFELIANDTNRGVSGGNNVGWRASRGDIVIFVNPDVEVTPGWMEALVEPLLDPESRVGITGSKLLYPGTRTIQHAGGIIYPNGMVDHFGNGEEDVGQWDHVEDVDYVTGASLAIRRGLLEDLGGFDEDFNPAYYEETDLCVRARRMGWAVRMVPRSVAYHHESTVLQRRSARFLRLFYRGRMRFVMKTMTWRELFFTWLPAEVMWMFTPHARGGRLRQLRAYCQGIGYAWGRWRRRRHAGRPLITTAHSD
ncbi:glycosyltransferase family 2 protein [Candidatus Sumerlaeota bacterium]|nr:glycosyltransferase family 2 protein [Candidatus Sumerlaeota bacterium]